MIPECFLLVVSWLVIGDPIPRFAPSKDLDGRGKAEFVALVREDRYEVLRKRWLIAGDPKHLISDDSRQALDDSGLIVRVNREVLMKNKVRKLGISVEKELYDKHESVFKSLRSKLDKRFVGKSAIDCCMELQEVAMELESLKVNDQIARVSVEFKMDNYVSKIPEIWMLIEVFPSQPEYSAYATSVYHRIKCRSGRAMTLLLPHPFEELRAKETKEFFSKPLLANRPPVNDGRPPLADILDDGLDSRDREFLLHFTLVDDVMFNSYQIESVQFDLDSSLELSSARELLQRRIPPGKVLTYDELNAICAEFCAQYRTRNRKGHFVFMISPHPHGKWTYADLHVRIVEPETSK